MDELRNLFLFRSSALDRVKPFATSVFKLSKEEVGHDRWRKADV